MMLWHKYRSVAPGAYSPEKVRLNTTPQYSFGIKHASDKPSDIPGNQRIIIATPWNIC